MTSCGRRGFLLRTAAVGFALREASPAAAQAGMRLGLIVSVGKDPEAAIAKWDRAFCELLCGLRGAVATFPVSRLHGQVIDHGHHYSRPEVFSGCLRRK